MNDFSLGTQNFEEQLNANINNDDDNNKEVLKDVMNEFVNGNNRIRKTCSYYMLEKLDKELEKQVQRINREKAKKGQKFKKIKKGQLLEKILIKTFNLE